MQNAVRGERSESAKVLVVCGDDVGVGGGEVDEFGLEVRASHGVSLPRDATDGCGWCGDTTATTVALMSSRNVHDWLFVFAAANILALALRVQ